MRRVFLAAAAAASLPLSLPLAGCHAVTTSHALAEGVTPQARPADSHVEFLAGRPHRPFRSLGTVEVRVDRGNAMVNPTLADAMPALAAEARRIGADAVVLTHEEFTSWFDKGEDRSPIHDLERQETWYITEKARYVSGVAIAYTGACPPGMTAPVYRAPAPATVPAPPPAWTPPPPVYAPPAAPPPPPPVAPPPPPPPVAPTAPSLPEGPIELPELPDVPDLPPLPDTPGSGEAR